MPAPTPLAIVTPSERPGPGARSLWRINAAILWALVAALLSAFAYYVHWSLPLTVLAIGIAVVALLDLTAAPEIRFRVHRYEIGEQSVISRSGWLVVQHRITPISRIQTVDVQRGPTARLLGLSTLVVSTASSAGAIRIVALDADVAATVADDLLRRSDAAQGVDGP
jgi:membrane protein YdbS with pleckstrin-like domain